MPAPSPPSAAIVAVEIILGYYFDRDPWLLPWDRWYRRSQELTWSDRSVVITFVLIGLAGILLLALQLWRRPPLALPLEDTTPDVHTEINRRSLEQVLSSRCAQRRGGQRQRTSARAGVGSPCMP